MLGPGDALAFCRVRLSASKPLPEECPTQPMTLSEHVLRRRLELGLMVKEAAERIGADSQSVTAWEHGLAGGV